MRIVRESVDDPAKKLWGCSAERRTKCVCCGRSTELDQVTRHRKDLHTRITVRSYGKIEQTSEEKKAGEE